jgi:hypothetical protein
MTVYFDQNVRAFGKCAVHSVIEEVSVCLVPLTRRHSASIQEDRAYLS